MIDYFFQDVVQPTLTMKPQLHSGSLIHIDETQVQVLKEPGKSPQSRSYMWVQRGGPPDTPVIHFHYDPSGPRMLQVSYWVALQVWWWAMAMNPTVKWQLTTQTLFIFVVSHTHEQRTKSPDTLQRPDICLHYPSTSLGACATVWREGCLNFKRCKLRLWFSVAWQNRDVHICPCIIHLAYLISSFRNLSFNKILIFY